VRDVVQMAVRGHVNARPICKATTSSGKKSLSIGGLGGASMVGMALRAFTTNFALPTCVVTNPSSGSKQNNVKRR
jgi:hypothetical protein